MNLLNRQFEKARSAFRLGLGRMRRDACQLNCLAIEAIKAVTGEFKERRKTLTVELFKALIANLAMSEIENTAVSCDGARRGKPLRKQSRDQCLQRGHFGDEASVFFFLDHIALHSSARPFAPFIDWFRP